MDASTTSTTAAAGAETTVGVTSSMSGAVPSGAQLWVIRHGATDWSTSGKHTGRTDRPLNPDGERQARGLAELCARIRPAYVLSSPRSRALRTAEIAGLTVDAVDDDAAEWDYGDFEGLTTPQIRRTYPGWTIWSGPVPGGESLAEVQTRADRLLDRVADHLSRGPVVVFGHGHFNRVLSARWLRQPGDFGAHLALGTAAPCLLGEEHGVPAIVRWNVGDPG